MTQTERVKEWANFYRQSPLKYNCNALIACYRTDGEKVLSLVLQELGLELSVSLVKDAANNE